MTVSWRQLFVVYLWVFLKQMLSRDGLNRSELLDDVLHVPVLEATDLTSALCRTTHAVQDSFVQAILIEQVVVACDFGACKDVARCKR